MRFPAQHRGRSLPFVIAASLALPPILLSQEHDHPHQVGKLGRVVFPVSCTPAAQQKFEHAMAVLHSFWWEEGDRAFGDVLAADSTCTMAYWGLALNAWGNPFAGGPTGDAVGKGAEAAARASALPVRTARERGFVAATAALYRNAESTPNAARLQAYADTMARLYRQFPKDVEVTIYYALGQLATASKTDTTFAQQKRAIAILDPLFARYPNHPGLAHYVIHATDTPRLAHLGLNAARRYSQIAPAAPHAQHMPSHIFVRLGLWNETIASNWKSYQAGESYARAMNKPGAPEELHALDYAVYGYLQEGRDSAARAAVAEAGDVKTNTRGLVAAYNRTAMAARLPLERGDWAAAAEFPPPADTLAPVATALVRFTRAIGNTRSGHPEKAAPEVKALDSIATALEAKGEPYWSRVVRIKRDAAESWVRMASGDTQGALALARAAADSEEVTDKHPVTPAELLPARELEADMLLATGHPAEARAAYRATLAREPNRARSLFGMARAAELAGDRQEAGSDYKKFLQLMAKADRDRPEVATAKAFPTRLSLP
ncbi:MAG TPA: tetratricopeptide repeat protein [Gemmatimonadales bacterium]|nr:tetratricopeptide repeat protein [Gemmatimonadales bacterium]